MLNLRKHTNSNHKSKLLLWLLFFLFNQSLFAQYNLVPNYSFENYTICPSDTNDVLPMPWYEPTNVLGAGYFNGCSNDTTLGVPRNSFAGNGFQYARTGVAFGGIFFMKQPNSNSRNYIQVILIDSLQKNKCYYVEFYINHANNLTIACNNISMAITNNKIWADTINDPYGVIPYNAQIFNYGNPIIKDTLNWIKVSGVFVAQGGEQHITIGNFKKDNQTNYISLPPPVGFNYNGAAYNIDDVSIIPLDSMPLKADAGRDTTIHIGDSAFIGSLTNGIDSLKWLNQNTGNNIDSTRPGFWVHPQQNTCYVLTQTVNGYTSSDTVCVNVLPLPLKFINLTLNPSPTERDLITVHWQTANEINVSYFYVQRSTNGKDFNIIGKVNANGANYNEYSYEDKSLPFMVDGSVVYYRIEAVDYNGKKNYSTIQQITIKHQTPNSVSVFPNPAKDLVNVSCENAKQVMIIDYLGRVVYADKINRTSYIVNLTSLLKGLYIVEIVTNKGEVRNEKFVIE